ncbi:MAG: ABC transporter permease subunit, partial [bacterium]
ALYYTIGLISYTVMIVALFPSISSVKIDYLQQLPENLIKFFGSDSASIMTFNGFISLEFLSLFFVLIIAFFIGSSAGATIAGSKERKTLDFQLSQPISRPTLIISETIVGLIYTMFFVIMTSASIYLSGKIFGVSINDNGLIAFTLVATLFLWAIYGIAIFLSSIMANKIAVAGATVSIVMAFYIFTALTSIITKFNNFDKLSIFYTYNPQKLLENGHIHIHQIEALIVIFIIGIVASIVFFNKKDV